MSWDDRDIALSLLLIAIVLWVWVELARDRRTIRALAYQLAELREAARPFLAEKVN